jgi:hypothetical protein
MVISAEVTGAFARSFAAATVDHFSRERQAAQVAVTLLEVQARQAAQVAASRVRTAVQAEAPAFGTASGSQEEASSMHRKSACLEALAASLASKTASNAASLASKAASLAPAAALDRHQAETWAAASRRYAEDSCLYAFAERYWGVAHRAFQVCESLTAAYGRCSRRLADTLPFVKVYLQRLGSRSGV